MESGDYSIYGWPSLGGADLGFHMNQTYNVDPEIGRLVRTKDFRIAFSHALDRNAINETAQLGLGVIQNRVPHPSTPYNPADDELTQLYMERDLDKANMLLDGIGPKQSGLRRIPNVAQRPAGKHYVPIRFRRRPTCHCGTDEGATCRGWNRDSSRRKWTVVHTAPFSARVLHHRHEPLASHRESMDALHDKLRSVRQSLLLPGYGDCEILRYCR